MLSGDTSFRLGVAAQRPTGAGGIWLPMNYDAQCSHTLHPHTPLKPPSPQNGSQQILAGLRKISLQLQDTQSKDVLSGDGHAWSCKAVSPTTMFRPKRQHALAPMQTQCYGSNNKQYPVRCWVPDGPNRILHGHIRLSSRRLPPFASPKRPTLVGLCSAASCGRFLRAQTGMADAVLPQ